MITAFLVSFGAIALVFVLMAIGVIFGRRAIKGSCGGVGGKDCICIEKCEKRKRMELSDPKGV